jgi:Tfp pilus assembly protein PilF
MKTSKRWIAPLVVCGFVSALFVGGAQAGTEGRISGTVIDPAANPIPDVQVTLSAVEVDIRRSTDTNKKGKFNITVLNAARQFVIRLEKEGFQTIEEPIDPAIGGTLKPEFTMMPGETIAPERLAELERKDKAAKVYNEGVRKFAAGDFDGATLLFEEALAEDENLGLAHLALARIKLAGDDFTGGLPHAEKASELVPEDGLSDIVYFDALWGLDRTDEALVVLDRMVASNSVPDKVAVRVFNAGVRDIKANDLAAARPRFEKALELDPTLSPAHLTLAQITMNQGDYAASLAHVNRYLEANPEHAKGLSLLYQANLALGDQAAADAAFARLSAVDPELVVETFFEEGVNHFNAGDNERAVKAFENVLQAKPEHAQAHYFLGLCNASLGEIDVASAARTGWRVVGAQAAEDLRRSRSDTACRYSGGHGQP